jgi:hypothetical protein
VTHAWHSRMQRSAHGTADAGARDERRPVRGRDPDSLIDDQRADRAGLACGPRSGSRTTCSRSISAAATPTTATPNCAGCAPSCAKQTRRARARQAAGESRQVRSKAERNAAWRALRERHGLIGEAKVASLTPAGAAQYERTKTRVKAITAQQSSLGSRGLDANSIHHELFA